MNFVKKIFIGLTIIVIVLIAGVSVYVKLYGKALLEDALSDALKKPVQIGSLSYQFPLGVSAGDVRVDNDMRAKAVDAQFEFSSIFSKRANVRELIVREGRYRYLNDSSGGNFSFEAENIYIKAEHLILPLAGLLTGARTDFLISGRLKRKDGPFSDGNVDGSGWIDFVKKDMEGKIKVREAEGFGGLTADLFSRDNHMKVDGELKLGNFFAEVNKAATPAAAGVNDLVLGALSSFGVEIGAKFSFETKMDDFQVSNISFSGSVGSPAGSAVLPPAVP